MRDLNDLVSDSSLTLVESGKINDLGQIVGLAFTSSGELHGFLATPDTDEVDQGHTSSAVTRPARSVVALPELVRETVERQFFHKSYTLGRVVPLRNTR